MAERPADDEASNAPESAEVTAEGATDLVGDVLARVSSAPRRGKGTKPTRKPATGKGGTTLSGPGPDHRDPVGAADAVSELIASQGWEHATTVAAAMARWEDIAGPELAAHVNAESFQEGVLLLRADSTAWATQMRLLLPTVRRAIDAAVGRGVVADIRIVGPEPPRTRGAWRVPGRGPRDTYG